MKMAGRFSMRREVEKSKKKELINISLANRDMFCRRFMRADRNQSDRRMAEGILRNFDVLIEVIKNEVIEEEITPAESN